MSVGTARQIRSSQTRPHGQTLPGPTIREWWVKAVDQLIAPYVRDRGYDWEVTIDELPADLWSLQGEIPPPCESTPKNDG